MPRDHSVDSTQEFISLIKTMKPNNIIASLDVVSLFTNVPLNDTIDIILNYVYRNSNPELPPPMLSEEAMKKILKICTTRSPFTAPDGQLFVQVDGISMGCVLGPTFANFYMGHLESKALTEIQFELSYCRYVDDIFITVASENNLKILKSILEEKSVLQFTYEFNNDHSLNFLDVHLEVNQNKTQFLTSVHVKKTNNGDCMNFISLCPFRYKIGVIKTLLHRAYNICSSWEYFHIEVDRIKQLLTNNNFPTNVIDKTINDFLNLKFKPKTMIKTNRIPLFFEGQMTSSYLHQEKVLKEIVSKYVLPTENETSIVTTIYYKNRKLRQLLITNSPKRPTDLHQQSSVVYSYNCNAGCNANNYIGYTTNTLGTRMRQHSYSGAIRKHHEEVHQKRVKYDEIILNTSILQRLRTRDDLLIMEAILIKEHRPIINLKDEGITKILKIF